MPRDFANLHNTDELGDDELRRLVREQLTQSSGLEFADVIVNASKGTVILGGHVGTEEERVIAERVVTDVLGIAKLRNEVLVDPNFRSEVPESEDAALAAGEKDDPDRFDVEVPLRGESPFFADRVLDEDEGTSDVQEAIEEGTTWNPPTGPTAEGEGRVDDSVS